MKHIDPAPAIDPADAFLGYRVGTFRQAGLEARWTRTRNGAPIIATRVPGGQWYVVNDAMFKRMQKHGVREGFEQATALGHIFSVTA